MFSSYVPTHIEMHTAYHVSVPGASYCMHITFEDQTIFEESVCCQCISNATCEAKYELYCQVSQVMLLHIKLIDYTFECLVDYLIFNIFSLGSYETILFFFFFFVGM